MPTFFTKPFLNAKSKTFENMQKSFSFNKTYYLGILKKSSFSKKKKKKFVPVCNEKHLNVPTLPKEAKGSC